MAIAQPDITLLLDIDAVITGVKLSNAIAGEQFHDWVGRAWIDTVADVGSDKISKMIADARESGVSAFRQVTQRFPSGLELPIEYTTVRVGADGGMIAVGKSLQAVSELQTRLVAAQRAMEQDYWKLREVETRYRLLFDASSEAVLLRTEDLRVVEANPAAIRALGIARGWDFLSEVDPQERNAFRAMLSRARESGKAPGIVVHLGPDKNPWIVRASLINTESTSAFMLQLATVGARPLPTDRAEPIAVITVMERMPDGFVVLDHDGIVKRANRAFLDLVQAGADGAVLGQSLQRWLGAPGADLGVLLSNVRKHGEVRLFATTIRGELGTDLQVELSAAGDSPAAAAYIGVLVRDVSRRLPASDQDRMKQVLGAFKPYNPDVPLKKVIQDVVGLVEREYVESALAQTNGNRAAAAELLGMSRPSLYAKLDRYGLDGDSKRTMN